MAKKDINMAGYDDFRKISNLDEEKISNLLRYIENHGPISNMKDLKNVSGIDDSIINKLSEHFSIGKEGEEIKE